MRHHPTRRPTGPSRVPAAHRAGCACPATTPAGLVAVPGHVRAVLWSPLAAAGAAADSPAGHLHVAVWEALATTDPCRRRRALRAAADTARDPQAHVAISAGVEASYRAAATSITVAVCAGRLTPGRRSDLAAVAGLVATRCGTWPDMARLARVWAGLAHRH